ncbi:hypothetical protein BGX24_007923 [Mortierella sp. AD032]|nr:hypothetical protein BGX24_007923 [Mortierella sp. AD032]
MKITYIAIAAAFAQVCIAAGVVVPCTGDQDRVCRTFQLGNGDYYMCVCSANPSCQIGDPQCNSSKLRQCETFCATKMICNPGGTCPTPSECSNKWLGGRKTYKCTQFFRTD